MSILTENCVLSRTRAQDLKSVRKLNCWGSELEDVSIVRKMSHVEVLSLSVNNISTLADFAHCKNLQELYIRKNNIQDLNELLYLRDLPKLKNLWLADNPCAENDNYRMTVLRHLPNLQKLDNQNVQCQEVEKARLQGLPLSLPTLPSEAAPGEEQLGTPNLRQPSTTAPTQQNGSDTRKQSTRPSDLDIAPLQVEPQNTIRVASARNIPRDPLSNEEPKRAQGPVARSPVHAPESQQQQQDFQQQQQLPHQQPYQPGLSPAEQHAFHARVQTLMDHSGRRARRSVEITCDPVTLFEGEEGLCAPGGRQSLGDSRRYSSVEYLHSHSLEPDAVVSLGEGSRPPSHTDAHRTHKSEKSSPTRLLPKGGKNRNANILSAVLCLIKELDYASLEVVETAIHCRMEEMDG